jgi:hypothetical protein
MMFEGKKTKKLNLEIHDDINETQNHQIIEQSS